MLGTKESHRQVKDMLDVLAYADGAHDLIAISDELRVPASRLYPIVDRLVAERLLEADPA